MPATDLTTTYLGLRLTSPFVAGSSPLTDHLDTVRHLEDAGCAAVVLGSLFEEQISGSGLVPAGANTSDPDEYLEHVRRVKAAVAIPVIGSLNGHSPGEWLSFAAFVEQAGADAIELNFYDVVSEKERDASGVEEDLTSMVEQLKRELRIPLAVKLSPFYTALGHLAPHLESGGADGLVLFNRFLQPDIDIRHLAIWPRLELSSSDELPLRLRWLAILRRRMRCSLAVTGGVSTPADGFKAILAGADAVQMVSAILRQGPSYFSVMRDELQRWMESLEFHRLSDVRGRLSLESAGAQVGERGEYIRTLCGWSSWLGYQAYVRAHQSEDKDRS